MDPLPDAVQKLLDARKDKKWVSFSWITLRALVSSSNHAVNLAARGLVGNLRNEWEKQLEHDDADPERIIRLPDVHRFIIIGDPGEQDASQYVLVPDLLDEAKKGVGFTLICSDVIYPSGDVNDYVDGLYVPYEELPRPIYALPGNHDWYDGLAGFMYHFRDEQRLPTEAYRAGADSIRERFYRWLWRRPSGPSTRKLDRAPNRTTRDATDPQQPGSYFGIETKHVLLVCIDTGIDGDIDNAQAEWLLEISSSNTKPKVLVTGKPLVVNMECKRHGIVDLDGNKIAVGGYHNVDEIIGQPEHGYVAAIGGDIHNYQHYAFGPPGGKPVFHYVVSGGGGAYMSATHPLPLDSEQIPANNLVKSPELYPTREDSLRYFADRLLPRVWRLVRAILALIIGLGAATAWALTSDDHDQTVDFAAYAALASAAAAAIQIVLPYKAKDHAFYRGFVVLAVVIVGATVGLGGWWLESDRYDTHIVAWAGLTAGGATLAWAMRRMGWWREDSIGFRLHRAWPLVTFAVTIAVVSGVIAVTEDWWLRSAAIVTAAAAIGGWIARAKGKWSQGAAQGVAYSVQLIDALVILDRLVVPPDARDAFHACVAATLGAVLVASALTALVAWLLAHRTLGPEFKDRVLTLVPILGLPSALLTTGATLWIAVGTSADSTRATVLCLATVLSLPAFAFGLDLLRRWFGRVGPYLPVLLLAAVIAVQHYHWVGLDVVPAWLGPGAAAAAIIAAMTVVAVVIVHLVFLGAHTMVWPWHWHSHRETTQLTPDQATAIIKWRNPPDPPAPNPLPDRATRWVANLVFPAATHPHGPIQQFVAEIFDSDHPPFFKNFLILESGDGHLKLTPRLVTGGTDAATERPQPFSIDLPAPPA
jgi:calcineurin-like phosphoesterase family protein